MQQRIFKYMQITKIHQINRMHLERYSSLIKSSSFLVNRAGKDKYLLQFHWLINSVSFTAEQELCLSPCTVQCSASVCCPWPSTVMWNPGHHAPVLSYAVTPSRHVANTALWVASEWAALLSLAKQLRAPAASTVVTRVKRALSLTHKHMHRQARRCLSVATMR